MSSIYLIDNDKQKIIIKAKRYSTVIFNNIDHSEYHIVKAIDKMLWKLCHILYFAFEKMPIEDLIGIIIMSKSIDIKIVYAFINYYFNRKGKLDRKSKLGIQFKKEYIELINGCQKGDNTEFIKMIKHRHKHLITE